MKRPLSFVLCLSLLLGSNLLGSAPESELEALLETGRFDLVLAAGEPSRSDRRALDAFVTALTLAGHDREAAAVIARAVAADPEFAQRYAAESACAQGRWTAAAQAAAGRARVTDGFWSPAAAAWMAVVAHRAEIAEEMLALARDRAGSDRNRLLTDVLALAVSVLSSRHDEVLARHPAIRAETVRLRAPALEAWADQLAAASLISRARYPDAEVAAARALELAQATGADRTAAAALRVLAVAARYQNRLPEAFTHLEKMEAIAARHGDRYVESRANSLRSVLLTDTGRREEAVRVLHRALEIAERDDDAMRATVTTNNIGYTSLELGELAEGVRWMNRAMRQFEALGNADGPIYTRTGQSLAWRLQGNLAEAERLAREALARAQAARSAYFQNESHAALLPVLLFTGREDEAAGVLSAALAVDPKNEVSTTMFVRLQHLRGLILREDPSAADYAEKLEQDFTKLGERTLAERCFALRCRLLWESDPSGAASRLAQLDEIARVGAIEAAVEARIARGGIAWKQGRPAEAKAEFDSALRMAGRSGSLESELEVRAVMFRLGVPGQDVAREAAIRLARAAGFALHARYMAGAR